MFAGHPLPNCFFKSIQYKRVSLKNKYRYSDSILWQLFLLHGLSLLTDFRFEPIWTDCFSYQMFDSKIGSFFEYLNRRNVYVILSDLNDLIFWHFLAFVSKIEEWAEWDCLNFWMFDCLWMTLRKILNFKNQIRVRAKERRQGGYLVLICSNLKHLGIW